MMQPLLRRTALILLLFFAAAPVAAATPDEPAESITHHQFAVAAHEQVVPVAGTANRDRAQRHGQPRWPYNGAAAGR